MKILVLTSRIPWPLDKGDKLRAYHQIAELGKRHDVYLFSLSESEPTSEAVETLRGVTKGFKFHVLKAQPRFLRMVWSLASSRPFQVHWFFQRQAQKTLFKWVGDIQPEVIYCQLIRMAEYIRDRHDIPRVLDYMDALSEGMKRRASLAPFWSKWLFLWEANRLQRYEKRVFDYFDGSTIISEADQQLIAHPQRNRIVLVPNGVDVDFFSQGQNFGGLKQALPESDQRRVILFTGNMSYPPNVDAAIRLAQDVLPLIKTPNVHVVIAGTKPAHAVQNLASDRVTITGWLPDIRSAYQSAEVFVAPLRIGTGMQNKILEAMSMELPCVTTPHVMKGLVSKQLRKDQPPLLLANAPSDFANHIDQILAQKEQARGIARNSRMWIERNCSWSSQVHQLENTLVNSTQYQPEDSTWKIKTSV